MRLKILLRLVDCLWATLINTFVSLIVGKLEITWRNCNNNYRFKIFKHFVFGWVLGADICPAPNSFVEVLIPIALECVNSEDRVFKVVIKFKGG